MSGLINCVLTDFKVDACPNRACMYNNNTRCLRSAGGGNITVDLNTLARVKGVARDDVEDKVEEGVRNIQRILVLDKYREYLQGTDLRRWRVLPWVEEMLNSDLKTTGFNSILLVAAASNKNWTDFSESCTNDLEFERRELMGLSKIDYRTLRNFVRWIVAGGQKPTVRPKRKSVFKETNLEIVQCLSI